MTAPKLRANSEWHDDTVVAEFGFAGLRALMEAAAPLGAKVRISGGSVEYAGLDNIPAPMRERLERDRQLVWAWLGGAEADDPALRLLWNTLDRDFLLATTKAEAREAIRQLERDKRTHGGVVALDTETAPRPSERLRNGRSKGGRSVGGGDALAIGWHRLSLLRFRSREQLLY
jgi:hypothetical protein